MPKEFIDRLKDGDLVMIKTKREIVKEFPNEENHPGVGPPPYFTEEMGYLSGTVQKVTKIRISAVHGRVFSIEGNDYTWTDWMIHKVKILI
jgi:hypothetical protein